MTRLLFYASLIPFFISFLTSKFAIAASLPPDEVEALKEIAATLGKKDWNFSVDPCSGLYGWTVNVTENALRCDCSFSNGTLCHVVSILLRTQSLPGRLPPELIKLPYLQYLDLTRNYIIGTIPPEWGSLPLVNISINTNRVTGSIPKEIGNISTLTSFTIEFNQLSGVLPPELGNLSSIRRLFLTSNDFTGELPGTLAKLTTLRDFRVGDNNFMDKIPDFIQNWIHLEKLVIQASGLTGPIPQGIALLTNMTDLRIADLSGNEEQSFPLLSNSKNLQTLILRSCNINGELPDYLGELTSLTTLDLSFNKLSGQIPSSYIGLSKVTNMYLTGNLLTGPVPNWMLIGGMSIDLSYNNFTIASSLTDCQQGNVNLFGNSLESNKSNVLPCLRSFQCPTKHYDSLHINCGGNEIIVDGTTYDSDTVPGGPAKFYKSEMNWAYSSTGNYLDPDNVPSNYIATTNSTLSMSNPALYKTARLSPLSLTYYGFCLENGNYIVKLHFAEIIFTADKSYSSLGVRVFDIYIQGERVENNFNIENEAEPDGEIVKIYYPSVRNNTLDIRLYWAGRGTLAIPTRGIYGPLISAISVIYTNTQAGNGNGNSKNFGIVVGIVAAIAFIVFVLAVLWWKGCLGRRYSVADDLKGLDLQINLFTLRQIKAATNNFDPSNKIGEGGFGSVYKGRLSDGKYVAVKKLSTISKQGNREFVNEIGTISSLQHPHLVKLHGCCIEGNQLMLVYEYMENNSLARALFGQSRLKLDWPTRRRICIGIAKGLAFLHEESRLKIVHRDIKATNVLLDKNLSPKISDFGLAKLDEQDNTHMSTRIAGTYGYIAPEYAMRGYLTDKADVYSFGVVALEIVSGKNNTSGWEIDECFGLLDWALALKEVGKLMDLVDPRLGSIFDEDEVMGMINIALQCTSVMPAARPSMSLVVRMLEGRATVPDFVPESDSVSVRHINLALRISNGRSSGEHTSQGLTGSISNNVEWTNSSRSTPEPHPVSGASEKYGGTSEIRRSKVTRRLDEDKYPMLDGSHVTQNNHGSSEETTYL